MTTQNKYEALMVLARELVQSQKVLDDKKQTDGLKHIAKITQIAAVQTLDTLLHKWGEI